MYEGPSIAMTKWAPQNERIDEINKSKEVTEVYDRLRPEGIYEREKERCKIVRL